MSQITTETPPEAAAGRPGAIVPLVVDVDGTLLRTDLLIESCFALLRTRPWLVVLLPLWLIRGRAYLKWRIVTAGAEIAAATLPYHLPLLDWLREERARGRLLYIASASDRRLADQVAAYLGLFEGVFASTATVNLTGPRKAEFLVRAFGEGGFDYAGNAWPDMAVWAKARTAILVDCPDRVAAAQSRLSGPAALVIHGPPVKARDRLRALRPHQWLKNLLLFVPILAAHRLDLSTLTVGLIAAVAFSLCASAVYVINDLVDLQSDRAHPTKRQRPFASGAVPVQDGLVLVPVLFGAAVLVAASLSWPLLATLALYFALTAAYSFHMKRLALIDVLCLAGLYTLRIFAGAVATAIPVSPWLLAFSMFFFLALALIKRCTELTERRDLGGAPPGRGYRTEDLAVLNGMAAAAGYSAVLVMALYIQSADVLALYTHPSFLWLVCPLLLYWGSRMLLLASRGEMDEDPVVFAARDPVSWGIGILIAAIAFGAA